MDRVFRGVGVVALFGAVVLGLGAARVSPQRALCKAIEADLPLLQAAVQSSGATNGVISPLGARATLLATYLGATGQTARELAAVLGLESEGPEVLSEWRKAEKLRQSAMSGKDAAMEEATSAWIDPTYATFRTSYINLVGGGLGAELHEIRFSDEDALEEMNGWVREHSHGMLKGVLGEQDIASRSQGAIIDEPGLVVLQSTYFKSPWQMQFDWPKTSNHVFNVIGNTNRVDVPTMYLRTELAYAEDDHLQVTALPYRDGHYVMLLVLPKEPLGSYHASLLATPERVATLVEQAQIRDVELLLPMFDMSLDTSLKPGLERLGAGRVFDPALAELDGMLVPTSQAYKAYLSDLRQRSRLVINEDGTEAASATAAVHYTIGCSASMDMGPTPFHAQHPFLFAIIHVETSSIAFAGWVGDPSTVPCPPPKKRRRRRRR